ncbi:MAG: ComEC/Rec2 family competence protein, partial [Alphaproteobacteria bacterium]
MDHKRAIDREVAPAEFAQRLARRLIGAFRAQRERRLLAIPLPLALGIAWYHGLADDPPTRTLAVAALAAALALALAFARREVPWRAAGVALALVASGFALAQWQTLRMHQPQLERATTTSFEARVLLVEPRDDGARLTLRREPAPPGGPHTVRMTVRSLAEVVRVGDVVRVYGRLLPPSEPVVPGGFDFARWAYFHGLGAVGYAYGDVDIVARGEGGFAMAEVRRAIARHAVAVVGGDAGGVAAALLTGLRGDIPDAVWDDMQGAGLAHLLAISGLHIGLVAGTAFVAVRYVVCLWPWLALRVLAPRIAAVAALAVAFLYLVLAGAPVPTQRAFLMTGIVMLALLLDREAISLRLVALAACVVLALDPAALLGASFQMSFAAVTALVAVYERWHRRRPTRGAPAPSLLWAYVVGVALSTVIATLATAPFAAFHFGRLPTYGIVANLVAVPLMGFWIMPLGLVSLFLMPFGLDAPFLALMGLGIDGVLWSAATASSWPGASVAVPPPPPAAMLWLVAGGLWAGLCRGRLTKLAVVPLAVGLALVALARPPDVVTGASRRPGRRDAPAAHALPRGNRRGADGDGDRVGTGRRFPPPRHASLRGDGRRPPRTEGEVHRGPTDA